MYKNEFKQTVRSLWRMHTPGFDPFFAIDYGRRFKPATRHTTSVVDGQVHCDICGASALSESVGYNVKRADDGKELSFDMCMMCFASVKVLHALSLVWPAPIPMATQEAPRQDVIVDLTMDLTTCEQDGKECEHPVVIRRQNGLLTTLTMKAKEIVQFLVAHRLPAFQTERMHLRPFATEAQMAQIRRKKMNVEVPLTSPLPQIVSAQVVRPCQQRVDSCEHVVRFRYLEGREEEKIMTSHAIADMFQEQAWAVPSTFDILHFKRYFRPGGVRLCKQKLSAYNRQKAFAEQQSIRQSKHPHGERE